VDFSWPGIRRMKSIFAMRVLGATADKRADVRTRHII
jgi:hypothetical protein